MMASEMHGNFGTRLFSFLSRIRFKNECTLECKGKAKFSIGYYNERSRNLYYISQKTDREEYLRKPSYNPIGQLLTIYHKNLSFNKFFALLFLIVVNQLVYLFGASCNVAAATSGKTTLTIEDFARSDEGNDSEEWKIDVMVDPRLYGGNLNLVNNKTISTFALSSANFVTTGLNDNSSVLTNAVNNVVSSGSGNIGSGGRYLDKIDNLERSVAAVLMKVAYGTTSTTKRSIPDNSYVPSLTTIATPPLTTLRYLEKSQHQQQINLHHRNYELDLERDHALPTSAPNADILKSNSNPMYLNPNRHHHDRDRHRHFATNSTLMPSIHNVQKKGPLPNPVYSIEMPSYSPPARSFLTPPLPPEYTNPFADKPTLRGSNNEGGTSNNGIANAGIYISRRPIPPPSLMPGQERIPMRPPDLNVAGLEHTHLSGDTSNFGNIQRKKALNTPSLKVNNNEDQSNFESSGINQAFSNITAANDNFVNPTSSDANGVSGTFHFQGISRILSGSNGRQEEIPEVLLRTATVKPSNLPQLSQVGQQQTATGQNPNINQRKANKNVYSENDFSDTNASNHLRLDRHNSSRARHQNNTYSNEKATDNFEIFLVPEPMPKTKLSTKSTGIPAGIEVWTTSTQIIQNLSNNQSSILTTSRSINNESNKSSYDPSSSKSIDGSTTSSGTDRATLTVAWNIHVYLSAILFTILAVYSIFKMIFYDKLTHLFNQSYFIFIHLILIIICMTRIFYLCYDAYNIHSSFHLFVSDILLNLPAALLTITFSVLMLFLLLRSLNNKNNRYAALIRPLTVVVGSSVHVGLCITLHYVESYTTANNQQLYYQQVYRTSGASNGRQFTGESAVQSHHSHLHHQHHHMPPTPPRVLSLICQIIYIFVCLSLGLLYLYLYRLLKRVLHNKSQNYIHGYQNLSYAIHITIATALLFILLAALHIYGALSISTSRPLITIALEIDWFQWGYQFSLRLIEIAIITLIAWVTGLKTGGTSGALQREKNTAETNNISGFALFPCTSSSSQEHFDTDYPAICSANTNLHTYTIRTGKPIYDDSFALNSLTGGGGNISSCGSGSCGSHQLTSTKTKRLSHEFQLQSVPSGGDLIRSYETSSIRSASHRLHHSHPLQMIESQGGESSSNVSEPQADHYENPNFELRSAPSSGRHQYHHLQDNCYSEPSNSVTGESGAKEIGFANSPGVFDFQDFERPTFADCSDGSNDRHRRLNSRNDTTAKCSKTLIGLSRDSCLRQNILDRSSYDNPDRRSSNSTHSGVSNRNHSVYNSFERRGVRKSGTLNSIGNVGHISQQGVRNKSASPSFSSSQRPFGIQTLNSTQTKTQNNSRSAIAVLESSVKQQGSGVFCRVNDRSQNYRSSLERSTSSVLNQHCRHQYAPPSSDDTDEFCSSNPERATLINNSSSFGGLSSACNPVQSTCLTEAVHSGSCITSVPLVGNSASEIALQETRTTSTSSSGGDSANSGSMLVAEHGFVRFRALDDINNAQGVGIHNASIRTATSTTSGRHKEKPRCFTNNT